MHTLLTRESIYLVCFNNEGYMDLEYMIHRARRLGPQVVKYMIDLKDNQGKSAFHHAIMHKRLDLASILIREGADTRPAPQP